MNTSKSLSRNARVTNSSVKSQVNRTFQSNENSQDHVSELVDNLGMVTTFLMPPFAKPLFSVPSPNRTSLFSSYRSHGCLSFDPPTSSGQHCGTSDR
jgi:hypothetical protein